MVNRAARSAATQLLVGGIAGPNDVIPTIPAGFSHPGFRPLAGGNSRAVPYELYVKNIDKESDQMIPDPRHPGQTAESFYKSYMDLVSRRDTIKRAIVLSNAMTAVSIGGATTLVPR